MPKNILTSNFVQFGPKKENCYPAGSELEVGTDIDADLANELLEKGAATDVSPKKAAAADKAAANKAPPTLDEFKAAVAKLTPGEEKHWTKDGRPDCFALESVGGITVTAALRDALWQEANPA